MTAGNPAMNTEALAALLSGEPVSWASLGTGENDFWLTCDGERVTGVVSQRVALMGGGWPTEIRQSLAVRLAADTATELLRQHELKSVLAALAVEGIQPVILKGTALAYGVYDTPAMRPREDTDLLIRRDQVEVAQSVLADLGYATPLQCDGELLFGQCSRKRTDRFGVTHALDVHWRLSSQSLFAEVLRYDDVADQAEAVEALGPYARMAGRVHALILACIHPVMHHRNSGPLIWQYDVHLLASRLSDAEWEMCADFAITRRVSAICAGRLARSRELFATPIPERILSMLRIDRCEPSATYLHPGRWSDRMLVNLRGHASWSDRLRLLREVLLPAPAYMVQSYGVRSVAWGRALLPLLYGHRLAAGVVKVLAGRM